MLPTMYVKWYIAGVKWVNVLEIDAIGCTRFCKCEAGPIYKNPFTKRMSEEADEDERFDLETFAD